MISDFGGGGASGETTTVRVVRVVVVVTGSVVVTTGSVVTTARLVGANTGWLEAHPLKIMPPITVNGRMPNTRLFIGYLRFFMTPPAFALREPYVSQFVVL